MKCLVTGAAGFIGSNLCHYLLHKGYEVIGLDNFSTGNENNLFHIKNHNKFKFIYGDIRQIKDCNTATSKVDIVFHQAALGSVPRSIKDPLKTNEVNIDGFLKILEASRQNGVKRIIYAASSSTYGDSSILPKTEENIGKPLSPYAVTKYVNELYADVYFKTFNLDLIGLRYFNVFGRRQDPNGPYAAVIPKFIALFLKGESPIINGDGSYSRDFTYIDNILQINYLAMKIKNPDAVNQVYNAAAGNRITIKKMTETIREELSKYKSEIANIPIEFGPKRLGDIPHSEANIEKSKNLLGYKPVYNFYDGIKSYVRWYIESLKTS